MSPCHRPDVPPVPGRSVPQTLLIHYNLLNSFFRCPACLSLRPTKPAICHLAPSPLWDRVGLSLGSPMFTSGLTELPRKKFTCVRQRTRLQIGAGGGGVLVTSRGPTVTVPEPLVAAPIWGSAV